MRIETIGFVAIIAFAITLCLALSFTQAQPTSQAFAFSHYPLKKTGPAFKPASFKGSIRDAGSGHTRAAYYWDGRYWGEIYGFTYGYGLGYQYAHPRSWGQPRDMYRMRIRR
jgi:hypothetical protein